MIDTTTTKEASLSQGFFQRGTGPESILVLGSCRSIAFLSALVRWNESIGKNRFTVRRIDPCEYMERGIAETIEKYKTDPRMLAVLASSKIFIHEFLTNYGMMNTDTEQAENIYDYGMSPDIDISIPNWNDHLVLKNDWVAYGAETPANWIEVGEAEIEKFVGICKKTSLPEFGDHFAETWRKIRYFWRPNHTSAAFTTEVFRRMNDRFLKLETNHDFWTGVMGEDLFQFPNTQVTEEDRAGYRLEW